MNTTDHILNSLNKTIYECWYCKKELGSDINISHSCFLQNNNNIKVSSIYKDDYIKELAKFIKK